MKKIYTRAFLGILFCLGLQQFLFAAVTISSTAIASANVNQGTNTQPIYIAQVAVTAEAVTVNNIQFTLGGSYDADDLDYVRVYFNAVNPTISGASQLNALVATFAAPHVYSINISRSIPAGTGGYFIIAVDIDNIATDNHTVLINGATNPVVLSFTTATSLTNNQTNVAEGITIQAADFTVASVAVPAADVNQGTNTQPIYIAQVAVTTEPVTVNNIQLNLTGTHDADDLDYVRVYFNAVNPTISGASQLNAIVATFAAPHVYSIGVTRAIPAGTGGYFIVAVDVDNVATDNHTVTINGATNPLSFGFTTAPNVTNSQTNAAGLLTIQAADITVTSVAVPAADVNQSTNTQPIYIAQMAVTTEPVTVNNVQLTLTGTHDADDLDYVRVYFNAVNPTISGASQLNAVVATFAAPHVYSIGVTRAIPAGTGGYFIVAVDIDNVATDNHTVTINGATNPLGFGFTTAPNVTNSQTDAAGLLTIQAADITISSVAVPAADVNQGTNTQPIYIAQMAVTTEPVTVNNIQVSLAGTHDADDLDYVRVYFNAVNPTISGASQLNAVVATFAAPHVYSIGVNRAIPASTGGYFIVAVDVDNVATDNNTVILNGATNPLSFGFTTAPNVTNSQTNAAGDLTIQAADITLTTEPKAAGGIALGTSGNLVYVAKMQVATEPVTVNSMQVMLTGTHDADDLNYVRIYFNALNPTVSGASQLNAVVATFAAPHTYVINVNRSMAAGTSGYFLVAVDANVNGTVGNTVKVNGATNPLVFGFTTAPNINNNQSDASGTQTLPVNFLSFNANLVKDHVELKWSTASELRNAFFELEHSTDGTHFTRIGKVQAGNAATGVQDYRYDHLQPAAGVNYYRVKQTDIDQNFKYSGIAKVNLVLGKMLITSMYPVPVKNKLFLRLTSPVDQPVEIRLSNMAGAIHLNRSFETRSGSNLLELNLANIANGTYTISLFDGSGKLLQSKQLVVSH